MIYYRKKTSLSAGKPLLFVLVAILIGAGLAMGLKDRPAEAAPEAKAEAAFTDAQKEALGPLVREYLIANPEIIMDAFDAYQKKQEADQQQMFNERISAARPRLFDNNPAPRAGSKSPDVQIVEFYDYNCGYCKKAVEDVVALLKEDTGVQFIFMDMPILNPTSADAARWALAAEKQGKHFEYHVALMQEGGPRNKDMFERLGKDLGLDVDKLRKDAEEDKSIREAIEKNMELSRELGIRGTPAFIIGDNMIPGYVGLDGLKQVVAQVRSQNKAP